jgi:hypothetical protein
LVFTGNSPGRITGVRDIRALVLIPAHEDTASRRRLTLISAAGLLFTVLIYSR